MITAALTIYTTSWCGYCLRLKTALTANRIAYDEVDIEHNRAAADSSARSMAATELFPR